MKFSFPYISRQSLYILFLCITFTLLQSFALKTLLPYSFGMLLLKSAIDAIVFVGIGWGMHIIIPSSNYVKLDSVQRTINLIALGLLVVVLWTTLFFLTSMVVFGKEEANEYQLVLPTSAFIGVLIYVMIVQQIQLNMMNEQQEGPAADSQPEIISSHSFLTEKESANETELLERVVVKTGQKIHVILIPEIIYIQSDGDYVQIVADHGKYLKEDTMKYFEANLPSSLFVRVHRSYIVNIEKISRIETYEKQNQRLILKNGDKIKASVTGYKVLREALGL